MDKVIASLILEGKSIDEISSSLSAPVKSVVKIGKAILIDKIYPLCPICKNSYDYSYGTGRFCSAKCARSFASKKITPEEAKKKRYFKVKITY